MWQYKENGQAVLTAHEVTFDRESKVLSVRFTWLGVRMGEANPLPYLSLNWNNTLLDATFLPGNFSKSYKYDFDPELRELWFVAGSDTQGGGALLLVIDVSEMPEPESPPDETPQEPPTEFPLPPQEEEVKRSPLLWVIGGVAGLAILGVAIKGKRK